jgi:micrococcal nuclease
MRWPMLLASLALSLSPAAALAHGGGLDAKGCHTDSKTGSYHCHGGAPSGGGASSSGSRGSMYIAPTASPAPRRAKPKQAAPPASVAPATLVSVGDGDTLRVRGIDGEAITVRLACIDAPETAQGMLGSIAREALHGLVGSAPLELRVQTRDRYGRTVAEVFAGGVNVGLEMVRRGDVFVYRQYLSGCDASTYLAAEAQAERSRAGVWRWGNVERPWDFRKNR